MARKLILFELNEVPQRVFDFYCEARPRSPIAQLRRSAKEYQTFTEDRGHLSPWVTWPTLHRGVPDEKHTIAHLGQDLGEIDEAYPPIWQLLAQRGITIGMGGSLHSFPMPANPESYLFYLPDTFAWAPTAFPPELNAFQAFNLAMVARSPRDVDTGLGLRDAALLLPNFGKLGFTAKTTGMVARQLFAERVRRERKVRRRTIHASLAFDAVMHQIETTKPSFATFFTNHVASAMHRFWAASFPADFAVLEYDGEWIAKFQDEIAFAMSEADRFVARLMGFVSSNPEYVLLVATSMGQSANGGDAHHTELMIVNHETFMEAVGVPKGKWKRRPTMAPDYTYEVAPEYQNTCCERVAQIRLGADQTSILCDKIGDHLVHLHVTAPNVNAERDRVWMGNREVKFPEIGLGVIETDFQQGCTGYHIPEGMLFAFDPQRSAATRGVSQVSTCDIAPSILNFFDVSPASYMRNAALFS
jgi:hypothetical protein